MLNIIVYSFTFCRYWIVKVCNWDISPHSLCCSPQIALLQEAVAGQDPPVSCCHVNIEMKPNQPNIVCVLVCYLVFSRELSSMPLMASAEDCWTTAITGDILQRNIWTQELRPPVFSFSLSIIVVERSLSSRTDLISSPLLVDLSTASCNIDGY